MPVTRDDFKGINDWYMDTSAYQMDQAFNYFLDDPKELDQRRLRAYKYYMHFMEGHHWSDVESISNYNWHPAYGQSIIDEEFHRRTWNVSRNIVAKLVSFLAQQEWSLKLPPQLEDTEADEILDAVWTANRKGEFTYRLAYMGCITGDAFIKMSYDPDFYADDVGEITLQVLDSRTVTPFFDGHDKSKMIGCRIQYPVNQVQEDGTTKKVKYTEVHTDGNIVTLIDDDISEVSPNPLGELLVVHIPNEPFPYRKFGRSDLEDLVLPNKELNEKLSDFSEILAYHAAPVTIIKGARVQNLEKGARKVWGGIPKDGDVFNLQLDADLSSSIEYLNMLKKHIHETGNVPEEALGALQNVSNTSAAALHVQYQPLIERIKNKQIYYGHGLERINELILKFYEAAEIFETDDSVPPALRYKTKIEWGDALPRDRSLDLSDISTEMGLGIESKKGALKRLGEESPETKIQEIEEEAVRQAQLDYMTMGMYGPDEEGGPPGQGGPPGTKAGAQDGPQNDVSGAVANAKANPAVQGSDVAKAAVKKSAQETLGSK